MDYEFRRASHPPTPHTEPHTLGRHDRRGAMSSSYKRLTVKRFPRVQERETAEARYWRNFTNPEVQVGEIERRTGAGAVLFTRLPLSPLASVLPASRPSIVTQW